MNNRGNFWILGIFFVFFVFLVLALGFYGGKEAQKENSNCTFGIGESLCWIWETHVYEEGGHLTDDKIGEENQGGGSIGIGG